MSINLLDHVVEIPKELQRRVTFRSGLSIVAIVTKNIYTDKYPVNIDGCSYTADGHTWIGEDSEADIIAIEPLASEQPNV